MAGVDDPVGRVLEVAEPGLAQDRAAQITGRLKAKTVEAYVAAVKAARVWWEADRREARRSSPVNVPDVAGTFMPWPTSRLERYVRHMTEAGAKPGTVRKARAAVLWWHRLHGEPVPDGRPASVVLSDHEATLRADGWTPKRAEPLDLDEALRILASIDRSGPQGRRDAAMMLLAYAGLVEPGRLVKLRIQDVTDEHAAGLLIHSSGPARLVAHWTIAGVHHPALCPVETPLGWARYLTGRGAPPGSPYLRPVDVHGNVGGLDRTTGVQSASLAARGLERAFAGILARAHVPDPGRFTLLSLRLGGIVTHRWGGASVDQLADAAGLSLRSAALLEHVRTAERYAPASTLEVGALVDEVAPG